MAKVAARGVRISYDTNRKIRNAQQAVLPVEPLADLDLRLLHCAGSADIRSLRARVRHANVAVAGLRADRNRHRGPAGLPARLRSRSVHHPLHRGSAQSALSARLLHVRLERGDQLCGAEYRRTRRSDRDRQWMLKQIYRYGYFPLVGIIWLLGFLGRLPRVMASTKGEGHERRYFYGSVWAVSVAQPILGLMWAWLPKNQQTSIIKLVVFVGVLAFMGTLAYFGRLPRTAPIIPGQLAVSD